MEALKRLVGPFPEHGIDVYYDNVGGEQLDAAIGAMSMSIAPKNHAMKTDENRKLR